MEFLEERLLALQTAVLGDTGVLNFDDGEDLGVRVAKLRDGLQTIEAPPSRLKATVGKLERIFPLLGDLQPPTAEGDDVPPPIDVSLTHKTMAVLNANPVAVAEVAHGLQQLVDLERYIQFDFLAAVPALIAEAERVAARRRDQERRAEALFTRVVELCAQYSEVVETASQAFVACDEQIRMVANSVARRKRDLQGARAHTAADTNG